MRVDWLESDIRGEGILVTTEFDVLVFVVQEFFAVPKVHHEYFIGFLFQAHQEVLGAYVIIGQAFGMNPLYSIQNLVDDQENCFQWKFATAES